MPKIFSHREHAHVVREPEQPIGRELEKMHYREKRATGGDFGGGYVHEFHDRLHGSDGEERRVPTSSLRQAAHRASEKTLPQGELKIPNLLHKKIPHDHHSHYPKLSEAEIAITERHPHAERISEDHSSHAKKHFQFSWWSPLSAMYRTAKRIYNFFASSNSLATSSSTARKAAAATFAKPSPQYGHEKKEKPLSTKDDCEERRLRVIDDLEGEKTAAAADMHPLSEEHHKKLQEHLKSGASNRKVSFTLEHYTEQMTKRAEKEMKAMKEIGEGVYSNLNPSKKNEEEKNEEEKTVQENDDIP